MKRDKLGHTQAYPLVCGVLTCIHQLLHLFSFNLHLFHTREEWCVFLWMCECVYLFTHLCEDQKLACHYTCGKQHSLVGTKCQSSWIWRKFWGTKYGFRIRVTIRLGYGLGIHFWLLGFQSKGLGKALCPFDVLTKMWKHVSVCVYVSIPA